MEISPSTRLEDHLVREKERIIRVSRDVPVHERKREIELEVEKVLRKLLNQENPLHAEVANLNIGELQIYFEGKVFEAIKKDDPARLNYEDPKVVKAFVEVVENRKQGDQPLSRVAVNMWGKREKMKILGKAFDVSTFFEVWIEVYLRTISANKLNRQAAAGIQQAEPVSRHAIPISLRTVFGWVERFPKEGGRIFHLEERLLTKKEETVSELLKKISGLPNLDLRSDEGRLAFASALQQLKSRNARGKLRKASGLGPAGGVPPLVYLIRKLKFPVEGKMIKAVAIFEAWGVQASGYMYDFLAGIERMVKAHYGFSLFELQKQLKSEAQKSGKSDKKRSAQWRNANFESETWKAVDLENQEFQKAALLKLLVEPNESLSDRAVKDRLRDPSDEIFCRPVVLEGNLGPVTLGMFARHVGKGDMRRGYRIIVRRVYGYDLLEEMRRRDLPNQREKGKSSSPQNRG